jgi:hypothetical protein
LNNPDGIHVGQPGMRQRLVDEHRQDGGGRIVRAGEPPGFVLARQFDGLPWSGLAFALRGTSESPAVGRQRPAPGVFVVEGKDSAAQRVSEREHFTSVVEPAVEAVNDEADTCW